MSEVSSIVCISSLKASPSNTLNVWSGLSTLLGSSTCAYPFPLLILPIKLLKRLAGARSLLSLRLISVSTAWGYFLPQIRQFLLLLPGLLKLFLLLGYLASNYSGYFQLALAKVFRLNPHLLG